MSSSRGSFPPRDWTHVSYGDWTQVSCIGRWVLYHSCHLGSPLPSSYCFLTSLKCLVETQHPQESICCCSIAQSCPILCNPWTAACQASLSFTISQSLLKLMSIELMMPSSHLILCLPLLLLPSIFPNIRVFSRKAYQYEAKKKSHWPQNPSCQCSPGQQVSLALVQLSHHLLAWLCRGQVHWCWWETGLGSLLCITPYL